MKGMIAAMMLMMVLLSAGCNDGGSASEANASAVQTETATTEKMNASAGKSTATESVAEFVSQAGKELALSDDEKVMIVSVGTLDSKASEMAGLVAFEGRVAESYPDRGTIILVDSENMEDCPDGCCPQARVPVRLSKAEGSEEVSVPGVNEMIIVVADLSLTETGYNLDVRELRPADKV